MKSRLLVLLAAMSMFSTGCGSGTTEPEDDNSHVTTPAGGDRSVSDNGEANPDEGESEPDDRETGDGTDDSDGATPEASGPLGENTFRIGNQTWERTLPMTTGQCFLNEEDGGLPTSATAWGTLDNDEDLSFAARYNQDGSFEAEVSNDQDMYWGSGPRFAQEDLVIELDFDTLTISGSGTFLSLTSGERAMGSFQFTCEPEEG